MENELDYEDFADLAMNECDPDGFVIRHEPVPNDDGGYPF
jgi:hypothetical protein